MANNDSVTRRLRVNCIAGIFTIFALSSTLMMGQSRWSQLSSVPVIFPIDDGAPAQLKVINGDFIINSYTPSQYYPYENSLDLVRLGVDGGGHKVRSYSDNSPYYSGENLIIEDILLTATGEVLFGGYNGYEGATFGELTYPDWNAETDNRVGNDVTSLLQAEVDSQGGSYFWFYVNNSSLGGDPYPGRIKTLWVTYRNSSGTYSAEVREGDLFEIPDSGHSKISNENTSGGMETITALYGVDTSAPSSSSFTTYRLRDRVNDNYYYELYELSITHLARGLGQYVAAVGPPSPEEYYYYGSEVGGALFHSSDADNWTRVELPLNMQINSLSYERGIFVACGRFAEDPYNYYPSAEYGDGVALFSDDGINWTVQLISSSGALNSIGWAGDGWITVAEGGVIWKLEGEFWDEVPSPTNENIEHFVFANGYLIIGTEDGDIYSSADRTSWANQARLNSELINLVSNSSDIVALTKSGVWTSEFSVAGVADIIAHPEDAFVVPGDQIALQVEAGGDEPLTYQWYEGESGNTDNPVVGATTSSFTTPSLQQTREYWVRVSNALGYDNSFSAMLRMQSWPEITDQPDHVEIELGSSSSIQVAATGENLSYQWFYGISGDTSLPVHSATGSSLFLRPSSTAYTHYWVRVSNEIGYTDSSTARISGLLVPPRIRTQPVDKSFFAGTTSSISVSADGYGLSYQWYEGQSGDTSNPVGGQWSSYTVYHDIPGVHEYWVRVSNAAGYVDSRTVAYEILPGLAPVISKSPISINAYVDESVSINVTSHGNDRKYQWYAGESGNTSLPLNNATGSSFTPSSLFVGTTPYWVRVSNNYGHADSDTAYISVFAQSLTSVTKQPLDFTTYRGSSTSYSNFSIALSAPEEAISYQWYSGSAGDTSAPILGATNATYTPDVSVTGIFSYWVRVTTLSGSIDSRTATANILPTLFAITEQPTDLYEFVDQGISRAISVSASGENLTYQWYEGVAGDTSIPLLDETGGSLYSPHEEVEELQYWVRVTSGDDSVDSRTVTYGVLDSLPYISRQPDDLEITTGQSGRIYVSVINSTRMSFQWFQGESGDISSAIADENGSSLNLSAMPMGQYKYWVRISNGNHWINSETATVTVQPSDYSAWATHYGVDVDGPESSSTGDEIPDMMKYAMGLDPLAYYSGPVLSKQVSTIGGQEYFTISFQLRAALSDVAVYVEATSDLSDDTSWATTPVDMGPTIDKGDGTSTYTFRTAEPIDRGSRFLRISVETSP